MAILFGTSQLNKPTPSKLNLWVRGFTVAAGIFMAWAQTATFIPVHAQALISSILGLLIGLGNGLAPFFGVRVNGDTVPADQVTAMDTEKKT